VTKFQTRFFGAYRLKRFDQIVLGSIFVLTLCVALVWGFGDRTPLRVQQFSWEGQQISVRDESFTLSLSQAVDPHWVAEHLSIEPLLPGKLSSVGKKFFYTLTELPIYGQDYQIKLATPATNTKSDPDEADTPAPVIEPFLSRFKTRDRVFAYIGTEDTERGRLILFNLTQQQKSILTPADLVVLNFETYPEGDRLLFTAIPSGGIDVTPEDQQLYTVTTGLNFQNEEEPPNAGQIRPILNADEYINGRFQLSKNGQRIIVQRINREDPRDRSLWVIEGKGEPRALGIPAEDFLISPDAEIVAISQQNSLSLVPLGRNSGAIQAKEDFTKLLAFSPDQTKQIALQVNNGIYSIFVIDETQDEPERLLLRTLTPFVDCRFEPRYAETLYCLKIDQSESLGVNAEEPFLSAIDLESGEEVPLLALPNYQDVRLSVSADGVALLFDQVVTATPNPRSELFTDQGLAVEGGRLWLLALPELRGTSAMQPAPPESLMPGYKPQWIP
jgi:hypothetical protein